MNHQRFKILLHQYFDNSINRADCEELLAYLDQADTAVVNSAIDETLLDNQQLATFDVFDRERVYKQLTSDHRFQEIKDGTRQSKILFKLTINANQGLKSKTLRLRKVKK